MPDKRPGGMHPGDLQQYNALLGDPTELPPKLVTLHKRFSTLYKRLGGGVLHPMLALLIVEKTCTDIETPLQKRKRKREEREVALIEERRKAAETQERQRQKLAKESKKETVGA